ncbi:small multi-drug export protein [Paenibacillaceae bacterium WGS1546]|uniref:small multi-drug export protein n=1 Tax=Cohnella sp. WGS1546 TaxID=3366810 RepID=UPI00372D7B32
MEFFTNFIEQAKDANIALQFLSIFVVGAIPFLEGYVAAPLGVAFGFPAALTIVAAILGNWLSVTAVILAGDRLQRRMQRRRQQRKSQPGKRMQRAKELFGKYGVPGVALIGPALFGNHIGAFISIAAGANRGYVLLWQTISIVVWTTGAGLIILFGSGLFR